MDQKKDADELTASEVAALGGEARAKKLTKEERSAIARKAAVARWEMAKGPVLKATHEAPLTIGSIELQCAVLENGVRVLSRAGFIRALGRRGKAKGGRKYDSESQIPVFLTAPNLKPFIPNELIDNSAPIIYEPTGGGLVSMGYKAELLPQVCNVFLDAKEASALLPNQRHIAEQCRILSRGFAVVGITALIDEATGYQRDRAADALAQILQAFVAKELQKWVRTFPAEFYQEMFRLRRLPFTGVLKKPSYIGHLTNDLVYDRLAPGVLDELRRKNPVTENGYRRHKHFQWLTPDIGNPKLQAHLSNVITLMKACQDGDWSGFKKLIDRALPPWKKRLPLFDRD